MAKESATTDRFTPPQRRPSGAHDFDRLCAEHGIEHRLTPPRQPQINGMVGRFNGRIADVLATTRLTARPSLPVAPRHILCRMTAPCGEYSVADTFGAARHDHPDEFGPIIAGRRLYGDTCPLPPPTSRHAKLVSDAHKR